MKTCVLIPAFNEAKAIGGLIKQICSQNLEVIVIDDGSVDDTFDIAQQAGAVVFRNQHNQGKGACLIKGFDYALRKGFDAVVCMDGDGQHQADDIAYFINLAENTDSGILIGNRMQSIQNMPGLRILTNRFMSWFISSIAGQKIFDSQCGLRLIKREVLEKIKLTTRKYETESEILIKAAKAGFKIESVPIKTIYAGERSQINPLIDTLRFIRYAIKELWITKP